MRSLPFPCLPVGLPRLLGLMSLAGLAWTGNVSAVTCYIIFDRSDNVIYRDANPPVDLSDAGSRERQAMRARGMHLLFAEFDECFSSGYISTATGKANATVDDIVVKLRPAIDPAVGQPGRVAPGSSSASSYVMPAPSAAPMTQR